MKRIALGLLLALSTLFAATGIGLGVIHISGFPYSADINYLNIPESTGMGRDEILANYNAVMDYLVPFSDREFDLPTLKYSEMGAGHFADCKTAFEIVYVAGLLGIAAMILLIATETADRKTLKYSGIFTLAIPLAFALSLAIDFDGAFVMFHDIFFEAGTWIFDPDVDEIIRILPAEFFMHCALFIAVFWIAAAIIQIVFGVDWKRSKK